MFGFVLLLLATNATISCKILVKIGPVVLAENILIDGNSVANRLQFDDRPFVGKYKTNLRQLFSINSLMYGDYKTDISFVVAQGTLLW